MSDMKTPSYHFMQRCLFLAPADPCISDPCQFGGTCVDNGGVYTCVCVAGFTGTNCETGK